MKPVSGILLFSLLLLSACQPEEEAKGPWLFGNLYVRYLQDGRQIKAEASFFEGDSSHTAKPVSILGGVSFLGSGMESRNIQDKIIRYQYENTADYPGSFTFQAQDEKGQPYQFSARMPPIGSFSLPDTVSPSTGFTIEISPAPGAQPESLAILLTDQTGRASLIEIPAPIASLVPISPAQLARLKPGPYQLYLVKKQHSFIREGRFKVNCDLEFYTAVKEVEIGEK